MPNWSTTNYCLRAEERQCKEFARIINSLPEREDTAPNDFGKMWLQNAAVALGISMKTIKERHLYMRGVIKDDGGFFGPQKDYNGEEIEAIRIEFKDGPGWAVFFTTTTAWCQSRDFETVLREVYPGCELYFDTTDEFGSFHDRYDPHRVLDTGPRYQVRFSGELAPYEEEIATDDADELRKKVKELTGLDIGEGAKDIQSLYEWGNDNQMYVEITVWKDINPES